MLETALDVRLTQRGCAYVFNNRLLWISMLVVIYTESRERHIHEMVLALLICF